MNGSLSIGLTPEVGYLENGRRPEETLCNAVGLTDSLSFECMVALSETGRCQVHVQNPFLLVALFMNPWFAIQFGVTYFLEICRVSYRVLRRPRR